MEFVTIVDNAVILNANIELKTNIIKNITEKIIVYFVTSFITPAIKLFLSISFVSFSLSRLKNPSALKTSTHSKFIKQ